MAEDEDIVAETAPEKEISPEKEELHAEKSGKRLTAAQWREIEAHIEYDTKRNKEIIADYGIAPSSLRRHLLRREEEGSKVERGSKRHLLVAKISAPGITTKAEESVAVKAVVDDAIARLKKRRDAAKEVATVQSSVISGEVSTILKQARDPASSKTIADFTDDLKALRIAQMTVLTTYRTQVEALDIKGEIKTENLTVLKIRDLTEEEIAEKQRVSDEEEDAVFDDEMPLDPLEGVVEEGT